MLIKTNKVGDKKKDIYINKFSGEEGTLAQQQFYPSVRREKRDRSSSVNKVKTNRKPSKGRRVYYQEVNVKDASSKKFQYKTITNRPLKVIKHIQETADALQRKLAMVDFFDKLEIQKSKWHKAHPEYQRKH